LGSLEPGSDRIHGGGTVGPVPKVDVVIVSYNSEQHLRACVEPLAGTPDVRVIVVDSASSDGTLESVHDLPISTVPLSENRGFAHACNVGWQLGSAPYVLLLNPDAVIDMESLNRLVAVAERVPRIGAVAPKIVNTDGSLDFSLRRFPRLRSTYSQALFLHRLFPHAAWSDELVRDPQAYEQPGSPEWASGACLLVRRGALERLGGLDDGFFLYCEDRDLCRRLRDAGLELRFEPDAIAVHEGGASAPRAALLPVLAASRVRYARKHQADYVAFLERLGIALGALTHAVVTRGGLASRRGHVRALARALSVRRRGAYAKGRSKSGPSAELDEP
jgi:N-acetylglucosaminyl-diphospho-decaprenol L-rhamnosyltransferase